MKIFCYFVLQFALLIGSPQHVTWAPESFEELSGKDMLGERHLPKPLQQTLCNLVRRNNRTKDCNAYADEISTLRLKFIDLNSDGVPEVIIQAADDEHCTPTGNCDFWILKKSKGSYETLLDAADVQFFSVKTTRSNGYADIVTGMHGSATYSDLKLFRHDGHRYRLADCASSDYSYLGKDGEYHTSRKPKITKQQCD
jgi:hypothetical protein